MIKDENKEETRLTFETFKKYNRYLGGWLFVLCMMIV